MEVYLKKYAELLVHYCLKLKKGQKFLIVGSTLNHDFIEIIRKIAEKHGCIVLIEETDWEEKRDLLLHHTFLECLENPIFDRSLYHEIALSKGAVLMLSSPIPHCNEGVDQELLSNLAKEMEKRIALFREYQMKGEIAWCIAAAANELWAKEILPNSNQPIYDLWNLIFDICHVTSDYPEKEWDDYLKHLDARANILNQMNITYLHYQSKNGTDLTVELPENYVFSSANMSSNLVNMPSLELFATPKKDGVQGMVKSTKPLLFQNVFIDDFWIRFEHGKVVSFDAREGKEMLQKIIETDEGSHFLGEIAFVDFDSKINQSGIIFENTLYDENASCHLALGRGFPECFKDGLTKSIDELSTMGMNYSETHVDFMMGDRDLDIVATLHDGTELVLMKQGKLIF